MIQINDNEIFHTNAKVKRVRLQKKEDKIHIFFIHRPPY